MPPIYQVKSKQRQLKIKKDEIIQLTDEFKIFELEGKILLVLKYNE